MITFLTVIAICAGLSVVLGYNVIRFYQPEFEAWGTLVFKCILLSVVALVLWIVIYLIIFRAMNRRKTSFGQTIKDLKGVVKTAEELE